MAEPAAKRPRKLCSLGTGEVVHIVSFVALEGKVDEFDMVVQTVARELYELKAGITDVRVCHPRCGEVNIIVTFLARDDLEKFESDDGPGKRTFRALNGLVANGVPRFMSSGTLMPQAHTLSSLLSFLKLNVQGSGHSSHDVAKVGRELGKWFPRRCEYEKYIHWDEDPTKYTRNLIFANEHMDVLLMCWPPRSQSAIHGHDDSSCWVAIVEGAMHEVQYAMPVTDKTFLDQQMRCPTGAVGRCTKLRQTNVSCLDPGGLTTAYANNDIGVHRMENRTDEPALTLHIYAPGLRKVKLFKDCGSVAVHTVAAVSYLSEHGEKTGLWTKKTDPDGVLDIEAWNCGQVAEA